MRGGPEQPPPPVRTPSSHPVTPRAQAQPGGRGQQPRGLTRSPPLPAVGSSQIRLGRHPAAPPRRPRTFFCLVRPGRPAAPRRAREPRPDGRGSRTQRASAFSVPGGSTPGRAGASTAGGLTARPGPTPLSRGGGRPGTRMSEGLCWARRGEGWAGEGQGF